MHPAAAHSLRGQGVYVCVCGVYVCRVCVRGVCMCVEFTDAFSVYVCGLCLRLCLRACVRAGE